ncbi:uncharacterized protein BX663DRAFT_435523 [Cokeromyces recurvatus]|uniref:uncharacterized protein n=1 Tax=Cokeromyces recurvatus TaxID=90255 RepID=UPI0022208543|nr:uncharacterized protein BX663DRAFT_435523 [Cokeromyces recurvatus]KAI7902337.1 hypothetical protein BX663DRAFT_435523 [Cokeromyces recurvatus]
MTTFKGMAILCFHPQQHLLQGHCINLINNESPYSLAGILLPDYIDPHHNDCMEPDDFYRVIIKSHTTQEQISLILRRTKNNDASNLWSHENEKDSNDGYEFCFETEKFVSDQEAMRLKDKYFKTNSSIVTDDEVYICVGNIQFTQQNQ